MMIHRRSQDCIGKGLTINKEYVKVFKVHKEWTPKLQEMGEAPLDIKIKTNVIKLKKIIIIVLA